MQCSHILKIVKTWLDVEISCLHCILWMLSLCSKHCQTSLTSLVATVTNISDVLWHGTPCTPWHPVPGYSYWWQQAALLTARWFAMWWRDVCRCPGSVWQQAQDIPHFMLGHHLPAPQQFLHPPAGPAHAHRSTGEEILNLGLDTNRFLFICYLLITVTQVASGVSWF